MNKDSNSARWRILVWMAMLLCILPIHHGHAQSYPIVWKVKDALDKKVRQSYDIAQESQWPLSPDTLNFWLSQWHEEAYLEASIDSSFLINDTIKIWLHLGPAYKWTYLSVSALPNWMQESIQIRDQSGRPFSHSELQALFEELLDLAENTGYPFAAFKLDSVGIKDGAIDAKIIPRLNERITIEDIKIQGDLKISDRYFRHHLGIQEGELFHKEKIITASDRLEELAFIRKRSDPVVDFLGNGATLQFFLDKKNANKFDILLGLLPSPAENRRFQLTGNVNVHLLNQFGNGEELRFNYESLQPGIQELELDLNYPFVFKLPFGIDLAFDLYKRDSNYLDVGYRIGIQYYLTGRNYLKFFTTHQSTNLLTIDTVQIKRTRKLPQFIDIANNQFGAEYHLEKLDYYLNPRRGAFFTIQASAGTRKIKPNNDIINLSESGEEPFDFSTLYSSLDLNTFKFQGSIDLQYYIPIFNNSTLKFANSFAVIRSQQTFYDNELFRIGGMKLLRGFNEEALFASLYNVFTLEYRLLFNRNSNLFLFADIGYVERLTDQIRSFDQPRGFGTGLNLQTKVGIFNISYALGGQRGNPLSFRNGRIHFGMITAF